MKKLLAAIVVVGMGCVHAGAQDTLIWFNANPYVSPTNAGTFIPTSILQSGGALVQLIRDGGNGVQNGPGGFGTTGVTSDDTLINTWWAGGSGDGDGFFSSSGTFTDLGLGTGSSSIYVRVWDRPTAGGGNIPDPFDYGGGFVGAYYFDSTVRLANADPAGGGFFNYQANDLSSPSQWTFLAIPEPGTLALAGIGLAAMLLRLRRRNS
jgi:hypothetical protein